MHRISAALAVACLLVLASAPPAAGQPGAEELGLTVSAGYDGRSSRGDWQPVAVTLAPRRPVSATLEVEINGGPSGRVTLTRPVEVAAGGASTYRFLAPNGPVRVRVREGEAEPVTVEVEQGLPGGDLLLGVLGELPVQLPPVRIEPVALGGTWVGVAPQWLELGSAVLEGLGTLVARRDDLQRLPETARRALAAALVEGTDLVVSADGEGPVDLAALGLPAQPAVVLRDGALLTDDPAWTLTRGAVGAAGDAQAVVAVSAAAGRGRLTVAVAAPGEGELGMSSALWSALAGATPRSEAQASNWSVARSPYQLPRLLAGEDRGVPTVPWLAVFMLGYVAVVGPANGLVLARLRRPELAWATVPLVTAVFTGAALLGAVGGRPPTGSAARLAYWIDGHGSEIVVAGLRAPTAGTREATVPGSEWTARPIRDGGSTSCITSGADSRVAMDLAALQFGGVEWRRPLAAPAPLAVVAVAGVDGVVVRITNQSAETLDEVVVRAATSSERLGALAPGQTLTATLGDGRLRPVNPYRDLLDGIDVGPSGAARPPGSLEALLRNDLADGAPGLAWVFASSARATSGVTLTGSAVEEGGTLLAVGVRAARGPDGPVVPHAVDRALVSSGVDSYRPSPLSVEGPGEAVLRYRLPPGGQLPVLHADLERSLGAVVPLTVWDWTVRQWVDVATAFPGGGGDPARLVSPLGEVYVRASGDLFPFEFSARSVSGVPARGAS